MSIECVYLVWSLSRHSLQSVFTGMVYVHPLLLSISLYITQSCTEATNAESAHSRLHVFSKDGEALDVQV